MSMFDIKKSQFLGPGGSLPVRVDDEISRKLAMLYEGECNGLGAAEAAKLFGYSRQRYYQLMHDFLDRGASGLLSEKRGPKKDSRRTDEVVRQVIRQRFLDPDASSQVIAQKLVQCGFELSDRSVRRVIEEFGLQKKTLQIPSRRHPCED